MKLSGLQNLLVYETFWFTKLVGFPYLFGLAIFLVIQTSEFTTLFSLPNCLGYQTYWFT